MRIRFKKTGEVTWVNNAGEERREFISKGERLKNCYVCQTPEGLEVTRYDTGETILVQANVIRVVITRADLVNAVNELLDALEVAGVDDIDKRVKRACAHAHDLLANKLPPKSSQDDEDDEEEGSE